MSQCHKCGRAIYGDEHECIPKAESMTDDARLRALCDAATPGDWRIESDMSVTGDSDAFMNNWAFYNAINPEIVRSLLDAKEERDMLRAEVAVWTERTKIVAGDRSLIEAAEWADARWADAIDERDALRAERDRLHADHAITSATLNITIAERDALRAVAEQARAQLRELSYDFDIDREALAALDAVLEPKENR